MKIAHIGDVHWGLGYPGPSPESRFNDISYVMDWSAERIIEERCNLVLFAGDAFKDARVFLDRASVEIKAFAGWLRKITGSGAEVVVISGTPSHDAVSAYHLIKEMNIPGVHIFTSPGTKEFSFTHYDIHIVCLPGMNRSSLVAQEDYKNLPPHVIHQIMTEQITQTCQDLRGQRQGPAILLAHLSYDMADKGFEDVLMQHEPVLTREAVEGFDLVCLGHIHRPQQNENVFYCGSPERLTFNDEEITPGFWMHEINMRGGVPRGECDGEFSYHHEVSSEFVETPARRFQTISWNEYGVEAAINLGMDSVVNSSLVQQQVKDSIVRLHYSCPEELNKLLNRKALEKALYEAGAFHVAEIKADIQRADRARDQEVTETLGPVEAVARWAEQRGITPEETTVLQAMTVELLGEVAA